MFDLAELLAKQLFEFWENAAPKYFTAVEHFERLMRYDFDNFGRYINAFSVHPEFNQAIRAWVHCPKTAKFFIDPIEKYYFDNEETDDIERYRWEVLYDFCVDSLRKNT